MTNYDDQGAKVGAAALKIYHDYGRARALQMYFGAIDALVYATLSINGGFRIKVAVDNTEQVEPPCDCGPAA